MERQFYNILTVLLFWSAVGWFLLPFILQASHLVSSLHFHNMLFFTSMIAILYGFSGLLSFLLGRYRSRAIESKFFLICPSCGRRIREDIILCPYCLEKVEPKAEE